VALLLWPLVAIGSEAWGQAPPRAPTEEPPFFVPQSSPRYPPAFQYPQPLTQEWPPPVGPAGARGRYTLPPWTPPDAPPPSGVRLPAHPPDILQAVEGRKLFEIDFNPNVTETWTDNFDLTSSNKRENYRTTVGLGANLHINGPTTRANVAGQAGLTYDTANASEGVQYFPSVNAAFQQVLSPRLTLSATERYIRNDEPAQTNSFGLNNQRQTFSSNTLGLSADWLLDQVATQGYYWNSYFSSGDATTVTNTLGLNASVAIGPLHTARVGYEVSASNTTGSNADTSSVGATSGDATSQTVYGSFSRQTSQYSTAGISSSYTLVSVDDARIWNVSFFSSIGLPQGLSLSSSLGYSFLRSDNEGDTGGVTSNSTLSYTFTQAVISLSAFQDYRNTGISGQDFGIVQATGYAGSILYSFTPSITGNARASYTTNDFTGIGNDSSTPSSNTLTAGGGLRWQILDWLSSTLQYTHTVYNSGRNSAAGSGGSVQNDNYTQNQVTFTLVGRF
jgi:hypothetical protein